MVSTWMRKLGHWAVTANDPDAIAAAIEELRARWDRDDLADSGKPSPYSAQAAVRLITALANEKLEQHC
ncbi:MAG: hypothetical protein WCA63_00525 [Gallionella sp.]